MEKIYEQAGLTKTPDGQWIGTKAQWDKAEELEEEQTSDLEEQENEEFLGAMDRD